MIKKYWVLPAFVLLAACSNNSPPSDAATREAAKTVVYSAVEASGILTARNEVTASWGAAGFAEARYELVRTSQADCQIEVNPAACADYKFLETRETSLIDSDLPWGNTYYYYLRVGTTKHNKVNKFFLLSEVVVPVIAPREVDLSMSATTAFLKWDHLPDVNYSLLISNDENCDTPNINACQGGEELQETEPNSLQRLLDIGKNYYFWVKATRNEHVDVTKVAVHKFLDPFSPSEFTILQKGRDLELEWHAERNTTYAVRRWSDCSSVPSLTAGAGADDSAEALCEVKTYQDVPEPFIDREVTPGKVYYYAVEASAGGKVAERSALVKSVLNAPLPTDFAVTLKGASAVVDYTPDNEFKEIEYTIYRSDNIDCDLSQFSGCTDSNTATNITSGFVDGPLKGNRDYGYWLEASIGEAKNSTTVKKITTGSILLAPTGSRDLREVDGGDCLLESESGLRWAKLTEVDEVVGGLLMDADDRYEFTTETNSGRSPNLCGNGTKLAMASSCGTADVIKRFNDMKICGKSNWRLPTLTELFSIIDFTQDTDGKSSFFSAMKPSQTPQEYWTADASADETHAVSLNENGGAFELKSADRQLKVRLVSPGIK